MSWRNGQAYEQDLRDRVLAMPGVLREQVVVAPAQTLRDLCQWVRAEHGIEVGTTTMHKTLGRFGLTLKNHPARRRADAPRRRASPPGLDRQTTRVACGSADFPG